jgi:hypothetical protein
MSDLANIEATVNWVERETLILQTLKTFGAGRHRAKTRELLGRLRFEACQLERCENSAGHFPDGHNPDYA